MELIRVIRSQWLWFATNAIGWSIAIGCVLSIAVYVVFKLSYDKFHAKSEQIYRLTLETNNGTTSMHPARVAGVWPAELLNEFPEFEKIVRLVPFRKSVVKIGEEKFYSSQAYSTDSTFFDIFTVKVITAVDQKFLTQPNKVLLCRSIAEKYFGSVDLVGKTISILNQQLPEPLIYTAEGVFEDFPKNSHFHPELLASFTEIDSQTTWAYTYFQIANGTNIEALRDTIHSQWRSESPADSQILTLHLQRLTDIHLYSSKTREMENNGSINSLVMLISGAFVIFLIAAINFINLYRVKFISDTKRYVVKMINGAKRKDLAKEILFETLLISLVSIGLALIFADKLSGLLGIEILKPTWILIIISVCIGIAALISSLALYPLYTSNIRANPQVKGKSVRVYAIPLLLQFTLSIIAIVSTLVLYLQIDLIKGKHPASNDSSMLVISNNPWEAVQRFDLFKDELLKNPEIESVSGAMEEPGGDILDAVGFEMEGVDLSNNQTINIFTTDSNFFKTIGVKPLAGTVDLGFTPTQQWESSAIELSILKTNNINDPKKESELANAVGSYREKYILNQSALKMLGIINPDDAIGKRFRLNFHLPYLFPEGEIVGVVPDFHFTNLHSEEKPLAVVARKLFMYCFIIKVDPTQVEKAISSIQQTWTKLNPDYPFQYQFISDSYQSAYQNEYSQIRLLSIFTVISIFLSSLGMFAMSSFNMQRRVKEIGIRKVNGAKIWEVMAMLNFDFVKWVAMAFIIATPIAYFAMDKWLQNFAYRTPLSWWVFALAGSLALAIALLTVSWQSWLAAKRNPVEALRYE